MPEMNLVSAKDIAESLGSGITERAVLRWARQDRIPCVRINKRVVRFDVDEVKKTLKARK